MVETASCEALASSRHRALEVGVNKRSVPIFIADKRGLGMQEVLPLPVSLSLYFPLSDRRRVVFVVVFVVFSVFYYSSSSSFSSFSSSSLSSSSYFSSSSFYFLAPWARSIPATSLIFRETERESKRGSCVH